VGKIDEMRAARQGKRFSGLLQVRSCRERKGKRWEGGVVGHKRDVHEEVDACSATKKNACRENLRGGTLRKNCRKK